MMHYYNVYQSHKLFATNVPRLTSWGNKEIIMWWIEPILHWRSVFIDLAGVVPGRVTEVSWPSSNDHWWTSRLHSGRPEKQGCLFLSLSYLRVSMASRHNSELMLIQCVQMVCFVENHRPPSDHRCKFIMNLFCDKKKNRHVNLSGLAINIILCFFFFAKYTH